METLACTATIMYKNDRVIDMAQMPEKHQRRDACLHPVRHAGIPAPTTTQKDTAIAHRAEPKIWLTNSRNAATDVCSQIRRVLFLRSELLRWTARNNESRRQEIPRPVSETTSPATVLNRKIAPGCCDARVPQDAADQCCCRFDILTKKPPC